MKTGTVKLMTLITTALLGTFSAGTVLTAAGWFCLGEGRYGRYLCQLYEWK